MTEKSGGGFEDTPGTRNTTQMAANTSKTPTEEQMETPKQNGRFMIAMIPMKKKPLPQLPTK